MPPEGYERVGESAARVIIQACMNSWLTDVRSMLDVPCGHGRVLRHMVKLFPQAAADACDIDQAGVDFCARQFGATPVYSQTAPEKIAFPRHYDLIWVGSLFTHLNLDLTRRWLRRLAAQLTETGIVAGTFHGRFSAIMGGQFGYLEQHLWAKIIEDYRRTGFGYENYSSTVNAGGVPGDYGISVIRPARLMAEIEAMPDLRIMSFNERGWDYHQDVLVFGRPKIDV